MTMGSTQGHRAHPHVFSKTDWSNKATRGFTSTRPTKSLRGLCMKSRPILVPVTRGPCLKNLHDTLLVATIIIVDAATCVPACLPLSSPPQSSPQH